MEVNFSPVFRCLGKIYDMFCPPFSLQPQKKCQTTTCNVVECNGHGEVGQLCLYDAFWNSALKGLTRPMKSSTRLLVYGNLVGCISGGQDLEELCRSTSKVNHSTVSSSVALHIHPHSQCTTPSLAEQSALEDSRATVNYQIRTHLCWSMCTRRQVYCSSTPWQRLLWHSCPCSCL